jgi:MFS transporter, UMF1 family
MKTSITEPLTATFKKPARTEILAWASYDIANSSYAVVVATAVYSPYFVNEIGKGLPPGHATVILTGVVCVASLLIVLTAPILGTICDAKASKKHMLLVSTLICVFATAFLSFVQPGNIVTAAILYTLANFAFGTGEDLIAAFLPELASKEDMGRISALGWAAGYVGGLLSLGVCLIYMSWSIKNHHAPTEYVPVVIFSVAVAFALLAIPTFKILKERAQPEPIKSGHSYAEAGFRRLRETLTHTRHYKDLFAFLLALLVYSCGTTTVVHLAAVYAQEVVHFTPTDSVIMILVVNVTAAIGAFLFGYVQDKFGSIKTLRVTLTMWTIAIVVASMSTTKQEVWMAANLVGIAMGSTGSAGRALVGQFAPSGRSGEFLGLWGVAVKLATALGAVSFGLVTFLTHNNLRIAMLSTIVFFIIGIFLLRSVDEERGRLAAHSDVDVIL